jgi:2-keto-3-deoxy-L-rhamnonate aldolase RhmA
LTLYPRNRLKQLLAQRRPALGHWLSMNTLAGTEMAAGAGWDWLLLDMEHVAHDLETVERHLLAAHHGGDAELVVRIPSIDEVVVKRLLDGGVRSFMFPFAQTKEDAERAVASTRYPPRGVRGFSGATRANRYGRDKSYIATYEADLCVIIQIESPVSVANIPAMGAVDGVDGMLIGMSDLAANLGLVGQRSHPAALAKFDEAGRAIMATGKAAGFQGFDVPTSRAFIEQGYTLAAVSGDIGVMNAGMADLLAAYR